MHPPASSKVASASSPKASSVDRTYKHRPPGMLEPSRIVLDRAQNHPGRSGFVVEWQLTGDDIGR